jgi:hypothetical protein
VTRPAAVTHMDRLVVRRAAAVGLALVFYCVYWEVDSAWGVGLALVGLLVLAPATWPMTSRRAWTYAGLMALHLLTLPVVFVIALRATFLALERPLLPEELLTVAAGRAVVLGTGVAALAVLGGAASWRTFSIVVSGTVLVAALTLLS